MSMTEEQVKKLTEEVGEVNWNDPVVTGWLAQALASNRTQVKRLQAAFVLQKMLRDDEHMQVIAKELGQTRSAIKILEKLLADSKKDEEKKDGSK